MILQWQGVLYTNLFATVHFIGTRLLDDWLRASSVRSTKDLGLNRYLVEISVRQPVTVTHSLLAVKDVCMRYMYETTHAPEEG